MKLSQFSPIDVKFGNRCIKLVLTSHVIFVIIYLGPLTLAHLAFRNFDDTAKNSRSERKLP